MATIKDIEAIGYVVTLAREGTWTITGYGITSLYVSDKDTATIDSLADPVLHAARLDQFENGPPVIPAVPPRSQLSVAIGALKTLDQTKPATIGDVVAALKAIVS